MVKESRDRNSKQEPARQKLEHRVRKTAVYRLVCCSILSSQFFSAQVWCPNVLGPTISVITEENTITLRTLQRPIWWRQFQSPSSQVTVVCVKLTKSSQHSTMAQLLPSAFSASPILGYNTKWIQNAEPTITGKNHTTQTLHHKGNFYDSWIKNAVLNFPVLYPTLIGSL